MYPYVITSRQNEEDLIQWLTALRAKAMKVQPEWRPSCFIVDDAIHERNAIKYVIFPCDFFFAFIFFHLFSFQSLQSSLVFVYILNFLLFQYYYISYNMIALFYAYNMINIQYDYKICQVFGILCQV